MTKTLKTLAAAAIAGSVAFGANAEPVRNIVLVHGAFADGSGWRGVYDELTARGYAVSIVQNPLTSFADDVAATRRVLNRQDGPAILVGHSYGGSVITEVGTDPKVAGLVYVAAFAPEVGQSTLDQYAEIPPPPNFVPEEQPDGFAYLNADRFRAGFAGDTNARRTRRSCVMRRCRSPWPPSRRRSPSPPGSPGPAGTWSRRETAPSRPSFCAAPHAGSAPRQPKCPAATSCS